ncbi:hypothetical protein vseg_016135 [Gypsophila vaccaria]
MAQQQSANSGNEEKNVSRVNSFTKFLRSPARSSKSLKKSPSSPNPLRNLLFRRKSKRGGSAEEEDSNRDHSRLDDEQENSPTLIEEVKEVVGTAIHDVLHHKNKDSSVAHTTDAAQSTKSKDESSTETKDDNKASLLDKFKEEVSVSYQPKEIKDNLVETFKKEVGGAKEDVKTSLTKEVKPIVEEVKQKASTTTQSLKEDVVDAVNTVKDGLKTSLDESKVKVEKKKEDGCVSTLAQGLEKLCAPWNSKKDE